LNIRPEGINALDVTRQVSYSSIYKGTV